MKPRVVAHFRDLVRPYLANPFEGVGLRGDRGVARNNECASRLNGPMEIGGERAIARPLRGLVPRRRSGSQSLRSCARLRCAKPSNPLNYLSRVRIPRRISRKNWRRERDSNPRWAFDPYTLSRGAPSTTRPSLRRAQMIRTGRKAGKARGVVGQTIAVALASWPLAPSAGCFSWRIRS